MKLEGIRKAKEEATKDLPVDAEKEEFERENEAYLDMFYLTKAKLGMIKEEEFDEIMKKRGKKK
jgi:hypothetical protein